LNGDPTIDFSIFRLPFPIKSSHERLSLIFRQDVEKLPSVAFGKQLLHLLFGDAAMMSKSVVEEWTTFGTPRSKSPDDKAQVVV
jgi:hypothetical protein